MLIFLMFLTLFIMSLVILINNPKSEPVRWAAFFLTCAGLGAFAYVIQETIVPALQQSGWMNGYLVNFLNALFFICTVLGQLASHYGVLMFSIVFSGLFSRRLKNVLSVVLLLPLIQTLLITHMKPQIDIPFKMDLPWLALYLIASSALLLISYWREKHPIHRTHRRNMAIMNVPCILAVLVLNDIPKAFFPQNELFRLFPFMEVTAFVLFVINSFISGVLGVKLKFEKQSFEKTKRAMTSGTTIISHTIKNEMQKIEYLTYKAENGLDDIGKQHIGPVFDQIRAASQHMLAISKKIKEMAEDITLEEKTHSIHEMIHAVMQLVHPTFERKGIKLTVNLPQPDVKLVCDAVHVKETILNLCSNAAEAVKQEVGLIQITCVQTSKHVVIKVKDNGAGIPKHNLPHVFEPFFSTKQSANNYGLGLSYCYSVMQNHQGDISIESEPGVGTTIYLQFPVKRIAEGQKPHQYLKAEVEAT